MMESAVNPGMCRCCASEGAFKDIKSTYHWMGEEEIYADMLRECFDIILNVSGQGEDGGICEVCITQLRNAINFKKQVLHTEKQFQKHLQNKTLFRPNIVKVEVPGDEESDDNMASGDEGFSGNEFEVPIKTELDDPKPKKRAAKASATTTRASAKKAKSDNGETSTKRLGCDTEIKLEPRVSGLLKTLIKPRSTKVKSEKNDWTVTVSKQNNNQRIIKSVFNVQQFIEAEIRGKEIYKHLENIRNVLLYSNATPIASHTGNGYVCGYCPEHFTVPSDLKTHALQNHDDSRKSSFMKGCALLTYIVKLDITGLKCNICGQDIDGLEPLMNHLQFVHNKIIHTDIKNHILPFKFVGDVLKCVLCPKIYDHFKLLQNHMNIHYDNHNCGICNSPFVNKKALKNHMARHKLGEFTCQYCSKVFDTNDKKSCHEKYVHINGYKKNKCPHCIEKFASYAQRTEHMVKVHGVQPRVRKCMACEKTFTSKDALSRHTKRDHLLERKHGCEHCDMKFYDKKQLNYHMVKHTGERKYECEVCSKAFSRKYTLQEHLRGHTGDKRFKCNQCDQAFVQKCSWKNHMWSRHHERV